MSVYVDGSLDYAHDSKWCHMIADSTEELHEFAAKLGLEASWFQKGNTPHYDLRPTKRARAVHLGAIELDREAFVEKLYEIRTK